MSGSGRRQSSLVFPVRRSRENKDAREIARQTGATFTAPVYNVAVCERSSHSFCIWA